MESLTYCSTENRRVVRRARFACRAGWNVAVEWDACRQPTGKWELLKGRRRTVPSVFELIEEYRHERDSSRLGKLVDQLIRLQASHEINHWLDKNLDSWLRGKETALAAVIEAAVALSIKGSSLHAPPKTANVQKAMLRILACVDANPRVAAVAAQRIRLFSFSDCNVRKQAWQNLKYWLDVWIHNPKDMELARLALPSAAVVGQSEAAAWLLENIVQGSPVVSQASVIGVINWATDTGYTVDETSAQILSRAVLARLHKEQGSTSGVSELIPDLVWALGAIATQADLPRAAAVIAKCFQSPQWVEDAAAIGAGRILFRRFKFEAQREFGVALGGRDSQAYMSFELAILPPVVNLNHHGIDGFGTAPIRASSAR